MAETKQRDSRFELMRIIAMLMIILHHLLLHTPHLDALLHSTNVLNKYLYIYFSIPGKTGVALFVLLSGYFLGKFEWRTTKLINLWVPVITYSVILTLVQIGIERKITGWQELAMALFPIVTNKWWFITAFAILLLLSGVLRTIFGGWTRKQRLLLFLAFYVMTTVLMYGNLIPENADVIQFVVIALLGWSLNDYTELLIKNRRLVVVVAIFVAFVIISWCVVSPTLISGERIGWPFHPTGVVLMMSSIIAIDIYVLFIVAINQFKCTLVNKIGGATLAIYLIHDSPLVREYLWPNLPTTQLINSNWFIVCVLVVVIGVFMVCLLVELFRQKIMTKILERRNKNAS